MFRVEKRTAQLSKHPYLSAQSMLVAMADCNKKYELFGHFKSPPPAAGT